MSEEWESSFNRKEEEEGDEEPEIVADEENQEEQKEDQEIDSDEPPTKWKSSFHRKEEKREEESIPATTEEKIEPIVLTENDKQAFKQALEGLVDDGQKPEHSYYKPLDIQPIEPESVVEPEVKPVEIVEEEPIVVTEDDKQAFKQFLQKATGDDLEQGHHSHPHRQVTSDFESEKPKVEAKEEVEYTIDVEPKVEEKKEWKSSIHRKEKEPAVESKFQPVVKEETKVEEKKEWKSSIHRKEKEPIAESEFQPVVKEEPKVEEKKGWKGSLHREKSKPAKEPKPPKKKRIPRKEKTPRKERRKQAKISQPAPIRESSESIKQKEAFRILLHRIMSWCLVVITIVTIMLGYTITERWAWNLSAVTEVHQIFEWTFMALLLYHLIYTLVFIRSNTKELIKGWRTHWVELVQKSTKWLILLFAVLIIFAGFNQYAWAGGFFESWLPFSLHTFFDTFLIISFVLHVMAGSKLLFDRRNMKKWWINVPIILIGVVFIIGAIYLEIARLVI